MYTRHSRRGFTIVEVAIAIIIVTVVSLAGVGYYAAARVGEIQEWHEGNALFVAEREIESWQANGYPALSGFDKSVVGDGNWLPYGYRFQLPDPGWNTTGAYKDITLEGFTYRVRARSVVNEGNPDGTDYWWVDPTDPIGAQFRRIQVYVTWGGNLNATSGGNVLIQETRMSR